MQNVDNAAIVKNYAAYEIRIHAESRWSPEMSA